MPAIYVTLLVLLSRRIMTLGHIVATTDVRLNLKKMCGKEDEFDAEKLLQKNAIELVKNWQRNYDVSPTCVIFKHELLRKYSFSF